MPVIQFPGYTKDPFGGPAGGTQQMFAAMLSSYMKTQEEMKKREQEKLLAELLGGGGRPDQLPGADPSGPAVNMPMPQEGYPTEGPQDYQSRAKALMSNPALDMRAKIQGMGLLAAQKELEPVAPKTKYMTIEWRDKNGVAQAPKVVPEDQADRVYQYLASIGATFEKPDKPSTPSDGITQIEIYQQQYEEGSPQWNSLEKRKAELRAMEAAKLAREGREGKSGGEYTRAQLVDDTFKFYNAKLIGLTDELTKRPLKGMEEEYKKVMTQMQRDQALIDAGKKPTWLTEEGAIPPPPPPKPLTDEVRDMFIQEVIKENPRLSKEDAIKEAMLKAKRAGY